MLNWQKGAGFRMRSSQKGGGASGLEHAENGQSFRCGECNMEAGLRSKQKVGGATDEKNGEKGRGFRLRTWRKGAGFRAREWWRGAIYDAAALMERKLSDDDSKCTNLSVSTREARSGGGAGEGWGTREREWE